MNESRIGRVVGTVITDAFAVRASTSTRSTMHGQHGVALFVGLDADVMVTNASGERARGRVMVVAPDVLNAVEAPGPTLGFMFDPERFSRLAAWSRAPRGMTPVEGALGRRMVAAAHAQRASISSADVLAGLACESAAFLPGPLAQERRVDRRVARVLEALRAPLRDAPSAALQTELSAAHLQALFARDVGIPMRAFRLWHRLLHALTAFSSGDATRAAHEAGFSDLAHFSRTCRRLLGYSPTSLRNGVSTECGPVGGAVPSR